MDIIVKWFYLIMFGDVTGHYDKIGGIPIDTNFTSAYFATNPSKTKYSSIQVKSLQIGYTLLTMWRLEIQSDLKTFLIFVYFQSIFEYLNGKWWYWQCAGAGLCNVQPPS